VEGEFKTDPLPDKFALPKKWGEWALTTRNDWTPEHVRVCAKRFKEYYTDRKAERHDWELVWRQWVRNQRTEALRISDKNAWWKSASGIDTKGRELGLDYEEGESFPYFKLRVFKAAGDGPWNK
jgi:hypothetical protein